MAAFAACSAILFEEEDYTRRYECDHQTIAYIGCILCCVLREDREKITGYVENVVSQYLPDDFKRMFRVSRDTLSKVYEYLCRAEEFTRRYPNRGRPQIPLEKALLMVLWYAGTQRAVKGIADRFGVQESTFYSYLTKIMNFFCNKLCERFIVWPKNHEELDVIQTFSIRKGFPGVLGAVDGTHIAITVPKDKQSDYINRKVFHSINIATSSL